MFTTGQGSKNNDLGPKGSGHGGQVLLILVLVLSLIVPMRAIAQDEGTPASVGAEEVPEVVEAPVESPPPPPPAPEEVPPVEEAPPPPPVPTDPPLPTAVPPTAVPPTAIPTQVPPTAVPTPTEVVWINTDSLAIVGSSSSGPLAPGGTQQITVRHQVTTPRTGTTIHAELTGDTPGWTISSPLLADANAAATVATWTQTATVSPGTSFDLPIVITAPATVVVDQTVQLRVWSTASTVEGTETGVAKSATPLANVTVVAPPPTAVPSPTSAPVMPQSVSATDTAGKSDPLVQDTDETNESDTVVATPAASPTSDEEDAADSTTDDKDPDEETGEPLADAPVATPAASPVAVPDGDRSNDEIQVPDVIADASPVASPVASQPEPSIACESEGANVFACDFDADGEDVRSGTLSVTGPAGWEFSANGTIISDSGLAMTDVGMDDVSSSSASIEAVHSEGCADPTVDNGALVSVTFEYESGMFAKAEAELALNTTKSLLAGPELGLQPVDFGTLQWDGESWGTSTTTSVIDVVRDECSQLGTADIQVEIISSEPGMQPIITSISTSADGLTPLMGGDPTSGAVAVARIEEGFQGSGQVFVEFSLTPENDVPGGEYQMQIRMTTSAGQ